MRALLSFFRKLFGSAGPVAEDHLMGAVDLSDVPYCLGLLDDSGER